MIIGSLEDIVTRLDMRVNTLERRLQAALPAVHTEPESPDLGDLEATIKSLYVTIEGLKNQLHDAKQTERDLDTEVARLTKENQRLTKLAWQAEQDKQAADALVKTYLGQLKAGEDNVKQARQERDLALEQLDAARRGHADMKNRLDATSGAHRVLVQHVVEQRRRLLSILGTNPPGPGTDTDVCDND
jgi:chromosome segregation ATPase